MILGEHELVGNRYEIQACIGNGATSSVYLVKDIKLNKKWAMKECKVLSKVELEVLRKLDCPAFPRIVDMVEENESSYLIMDYICGSTLKDIMEYRRIQEKEAKKWGMEIAKAIHYLHSQTPPIYYLDCKPDNIMLTSHMEIKIVDVGSAYINSKAMKTQRISGTRFYAPREQKDVKRQSVIDEKADVYSFGMTMYVMLTGKEKEYRDRKGRLDVKAAAPFVSHGMKYVIGKCSEVHPKKRYQNMEAVMGALLNLSTLGKIEQLRHILMTLFQFMEHVGIAFGILYSGYEYVSSMSNIWLIIMVLLIVAFIISCRNNRGSVREVTKSIYRGMGKKILIPIMIISLMIGGNVTYAEAQSINSGKLKVILYDCDGRKILVRDGGIWEVENKITVEIPIEEISESAQYIKILSVEEGTGTQKEYRFRCIRND